MKNKVLVLLDRIKASFSLRGHKPLSGTGPAGERIGAPQKSDLDLTAVDCIFDRRKGAAIPVTASCGSTNSAGFLMITKHGRIES